jgi:hypothetical protein
MEGCTCYGDLLKRRSFGVMNINLFPFTVLWMALSTVVIGLIAYRKWISRDEDDSLHVMDGEGGMALQQEVLGRKLEAVDRWGKTLTVIALVYGLFVGAVFLYQNWAAVSTDVWKY